jgi:predicted phage terminase large subunit-like protein
MSYSINPELQELSRIAKLKLLSLAAARKRTGVLNPNSAQELQQRKEWIAKCQVDLESWTIEAQKEKGYKPAAHHRLLIEYLEEVANGAIKRLMIFMPPGSAKSTYASHLFPVHMFQRRKNLNIIGASHTTDLALDFSEKIQRYVTDNQEILSFHLRSENKHRWYTSNGGSYLAAGVGTAIPGYRADIGIIDDPVKGREEADSEGARHKVWQWYLGSFERRLTPYASIILILTRWHEDDLAGRLLETQPDDWFVLSLPAEAEEDDPLGREPGEFLWGDDTYNYASDLSDIKVRLEKSGAMREWTAQYQQHPRPLDGSIFKTHMISVLDAVPADGGDTVRAWDLAATRKTGTKDPDWTRGLKLTKTSLGRYIVEDIKSVRGAPEEVERMIINTAAQDGKKVRIWMPRDPGQAGVHQSIYYARKLAGYIYESAPESGDKGTRAAPVASQCNIGNVDIIKGVWNKSFLDELAAFPSGVHDDQVDALSSAFHMLIDSNNTFILPRQLRQRLVQTGRNRMGRVKI